MMMIVPHKRLNFIYRDLLNSSLMPSAFKLCIDKSIYEFKGVFLTDKTSRYTQYVGVVVLLG